MKYAAIAVCNLVQLHLCVYSPDQNNPTTISGEVLMPDSGPAAEVCLLSACVALLVLCR